MIYNMFHCYYFFKNHGIGKTLLLYHHTAIAIIVLPIIKLIFNSDSVTVADRKGVNSEAIPYTNQISADTHYEALIDSSDLIKTLASATNQIVNMGFGNEQAFVVSEGSVKWVIPECQGE